MSSNYEAVKAELDNASIGKVGTAAAAAAGIDNFRCDTSSNSNISLNDERMIPSSRSYSSSNGSRDQMGESPCTSSTSSDDTLPSPEQDSNLQSLVKSALVNNASEGEDTSSNSSSENNTMPSLPPICPEANDADIEKVKHIEAELQTLFRAIQSYRKNNERSLRMNSYMEPAQRGLDVVRHRIGIHPPHIGSNTGNSRGKCNAEIIKDGIQLHQWQELNSNLELVKAQVDTNPVVEKGSSSGDNLEHDENKVPPSRSFLVRRGFVEDEEASFTSTSISERKTPHLHDCPQIQDLMEKYQAHCVAIDSYHKNSEQWLQVKSSMERVQEEFDAILRQGIEIHNPQTVRSSVDPNEKHLNDRETSTPPCAKLDENSQSRPKLLGVNSVADVFVGHDQSHTDKAPPSNIMILNDKCSLNQANQSSPLNSVGTKQQDSTHKEPMVISQNLGAPEENSQLVPREIIIFQSSASFSRLETDNSTAVDEFSKSNDGEIEANSFQNSLDLGNDSQGKVHNLAGKTELELATAPKRAIPAGTVAQQEQEERNDASHDEVEEKTLPSGSRSMSTEENSRTGPKRVTFHIPAKTEVSPN